MYAIVRSGGRQHKVAVGDVVEVDRVAGEPGSTLTLAALLVVDGDSVTSDAKALGNVTVTAEVVDHTKGPKIHILRGRIAERQGGRVGVDDEGTPRQREVFGAKIRFEHQFRRRLGKSRDRDGVDEYIVHTAQCGGVRRYRETGIEQAQIMAVPRPAHEPVLAEHDGLPVAILGPMSDAQNAQTILDWGVAAVEYIALEISRGRLRIPTEAK